MNFLNMFSDEAPISNNGYRSSLYTDPSIMQGVKFLNYERDITNNLSGNLRLISQTDGSNLKSGQIINGKIYEGMETSGTSSASASGTTSAGTDSTSTSDETQKQQLENQVMQQIKDKDIEYLKMSYSVVNSLYDELLQTFEDDYQGGIQNNPTDASGKSISGQRQLIIKSIQDIQGSLGIINVQISDIVKQRSKINIEEYYNVMNELRNVKYKIIDTNNKIEEMGKIVDPISAVAEREETHILSKQRYYMYIFWFIITAIVLYVMIANMIDPNSSFSILVICIIILVCIFGFIIYGKFKSSWYNNIKTDIIDMRMPNIPKIGNIVNFDPLVSIKYTS
jgi:hypothetical protein